MRNGKPTRSQGDAVGSAPWAVFEADENRSSGADPQVVTLRGKDPIDGCETG
jgi:hypothetical protein